MTDTTTTPAPAVPQNLFWEDVEIGQVYESGRRRIRQSDIDAFGEVTGDFHPLHSDAEFCKGTPYGRPIAHGLFGISLMEGLKNQLKLYDKTSIGSLGWDNVRFLKPLFPEDTVHLEISFISKRETRKPDRGVVIERIRLKNQHGEALSEAEHASLLLRKPS